MIITKIGYPFKFIQKKRVKNTTGHLSTHVFTFFSRTNGLKYVINVEEFEESFYAIKFYPKCLKKSDFKFNKIINKGDVINVLMTCASVIPHLLVRNQNASFGFVGSRTADLNNRFIEKFSDTKRYRVYSDLIKEVIGDKTFVHMEYLQISGYLLINKKAPSVELQEKKIKQMLNRIYYFVEEIQ